MTWKKVSTALISKIVIVRGKVIDEKKVDPVKQWIHKANNDLKTAEHTIKMKDEPPLEII